MRGLFDISQLKVKLVDLDAQSQNPKLWNNKNHATALLQEKSIIANKIQKFESLSKSFKDYFELADLSSDSVDESMDREIIMALNVLIKDAKQFEIECLFSQTNDSSNCFLDIHAGAGGTESHDWVSMMLRMYIRFAERLKLKVKIVSLLDGEEAGTKSCTLNIQGYNAYGWMRTESGIHRLVRISPFNSSGKRMTSFASTFVYPEINEDIDISIDEKDLRIDTYRASGAGGQHVNKTDSAVRITHIPTKIVVQSQNDRSQHKNKSECLKMLKAKLYDLEYQKRQEDINDSNANKTEIGWGHQIRSYVLQPYQMVKDLRTNVETSNTTSVLDGDLSEFVYAALSRKI